MRFVTIWPNARPGNSMSIPRRSFILRFLPSSFTSSKPRNCPANASLGKESQGQERRSSRAWNAIRSFVVNVFKTAFLQFCFPRSFLPPLASGIRSITSAAAQARWLVVRWRRVSLRDQGEERGGKASGNSSADFGDLRGLEERGLKARLAVDHVAAAIGWLRPRVEMRGDAVESRLAPRGSLSRKQEANPPFGPGLRLRYPNGSDTGQRSTWKKAS